MGKYETRTLSVIVNCENEPTFSEMATRIEIVDEAGGEFVEVSQSGVACSGKIWINPDEWPELRKAIDMMIQQCRGEVE